MGIKDIFTKKRKKLKKDEESKKEVSKVDLPTSKLESDLRKLKAFEEKIQSGSSKFGSSLDATVSQEEQALKLRNPFRGI